MPQLVADPEVEHAVVAAAVAARALEVGERRAREVAGLPAGGGEAHGGVDLRQREEERAVEAAGREEGVAAHHARALGEEVGGDALGRVALDARAQEPVERADLLVDQHGAVVVDVADEAGGDPEPRVRCERSFQLLDRSRLRVGVVVDEEDEVVACVLGADVAAGGAEIAGLEDDRAAGAGHLRGAVAGGVDDDDLVGAALGCELVEHARGHLAAVEGEQHGADGHGRAGYPRR